MEDFFKQFRKQLEKRAEPSFEERDWQALQQRLTRFYPHSSAGFAWGWLAVPLLLLLLGSNTWWYYASKMSRQPAAEKKSQPDTIFQTKVIYQTDTIYVTRVVSMPDRHHASLVSAVSPLNRSQHRFSLSEPYVALSWRRSLKDRLQPIREENPVGSALEEGEETGMPPLHKVNISWLAPLTLRLPPLPETPEEVIFPRRKKAFRLQLSGLRPHSFQVGLTGGWVHVSRQDLPASQSSLAGIQAAVGFSSHFRLWAETSYMNTGFETSQLNEAIDIPLVEPPSHDFTFLKAEVPQPMLQYSAGLHYYFNAQGRLKPFAGAGYGLLQPLPYEVIYEFSNLHSDLEWLYEQEGEQRSIQPGFLLLQAGFSYSLSQHWHWQLQATHRTKWLKTSDQLIGIQSGLHFRF